MTDPGHPPPEPAGPEGPQPAGETLSQYIARAGRLPILQGLALVIQLLAAVEDLHRSGRPHGGITRDRLRVTRSGRLVLPGPGGDAELGRQARSQPDRRSDLYAAAVVAYEVLVGGRPFEAGDPGPRSVRQLRPELPAELDAVFRRAFALEPDVRYQSAAELSAALQAALPVPCWAGEVAVPAARPQRGEPAMHPASEDTAPPQPEQMQPERQIPVSVGTAWELGLVLCVWAAVAAFAAAMMGGARPHVPLPGPALHLELAALPGSNVPPQPAVRMAMVDTPRPMAPPLEEIITPAPKEPAISHQPAAPAVVDAPPGPHRTAPAPHPHRKEARHGTRHAAASVTPARHAARPAQPDPRAACNGDSSLLAPDLCTAFRCATSEFRHHPVCVRMHHEGEVARARLAETRP